MDGKSSGRVVGGGPPICNEYPGLTCPLPLRSISRQLDPSTTDPAAARAQADSTSVHPGNRRRHVWSNHACTEAKTQIQEPKELATPCLCLRLRPLPTRHGPTCFSGPSRPSQEGSRWRDPTTSSPGSPIHQDLRPQRHPSAGPGHRGAALGSPLCETHPLCSFRTVGGSDSI